MSNFDWPAIGTGPCGGIRLTITNFPLPSLSMLRYSGSHELNLSWVPRNYWISRMSNWESSLRPFYAMDWGPSKYKIGDWRKKHKVINFIYIEGAALPPNWAVWQLWWSMAGLRDQGNANGWNVDMKSYMARNTMLHGLKSKQNGGQTWSEVGLMTSLKTCIGCQIYILTQED